MLFFNLLLFLISTIVFVRSSRLFTKYQSKSISDICIVLLYFFQVVPVVCDYVFGAPEYTKWLLGFEKAMKSTETNIIYDVYISVLFVFLFFVSYFSQKRALIGDYFVDISKSSIPTYLLIFVSVLPFVHFLLMGNISSLLMYGTSSLRGLDSSFMSLNANFQVVAIVSLSVLYFKLNPSFVKKMLLFLAFFAISYINGKRYMLAMSIFSFLYMYAIKKRFSSHKINLKILLPVTLLLLGFFCFFYITSVKIMTDGSFESTYTSLRIDFGRDDVVKYTIKKELIDEEPILEYPGETFLSTIGMIVPRSIWPSKPYPHYRYLTASLYGVDLKDIPAGMTPSILEMFISNFGWSGIPLCVLFLCWYCLKADKALSSSTKLLYVFVLIGMLTQSLDALLIVFYVFLFVVLKEYLKTNGLLDRH